MPAPTSSRAAIAAASSRCVTTAAPYVFTPGARWSTNMTSRRGAVSASSAATSPYRSGHSSAIARRLRRVHRMSKLAYERMRDSLEQLHLERAL